MSKIVKKVNTVTGRAYLQIEAKLLSISDEVRQNSNGKGYLLGQAQLDINGNKKVVTVSIYEKSLAHGMEVGGEFVTTIEKGEDGKQYCRMSHLRNASAISDEDFDALMEIAEDATAASASTQAPAGDLG